MAEQGFDRRILLKVSGEVLMGDQAFGISVYAARRTLKTGTASDYAVPGTFQIKGKVVVGLDEPVVTVVTLIRRHMVQTGRGVRSLAMVLADRATS